MSTVNLKLMACAARRMVAPGEPGHTYGHTGRLTGRVRKTTPRHRCQAANPAANGIRYALRVSRLPPLPVDTRTKLLRPNSCVFMRATIWAEQQNGFWFQACVTNRFRGARRIPQVGAPSPLWSEVILSVLDPPWLRSSCS